MWCASAKRTVQPESTAVMAMQERASQRGRDRPRPRANLGHAAVRLVPHDDARSVTRQALRRFRGNACAAVEDGLPGRVGIGQTGTSTWTTTW
jgi:hypothetical protein